MKTHATPISGIEGIMMRSPAQGGPTRQGISDSAPMSDCALVVEHNEEAITTAKTDGEGRFHIPLPPGHYTISVKGWKRGVGSCGPFIVDITAGEMKKVHWECDSGLR